MSEAIFLRNNIHFFFFCFYVLYSLTLILFLSFSLSSFFLSLSLSLSFTCPFGQDEQCDESMIKKMNVDDSISAFS